jgi:hypothetical protein
MRLAEASSAACEKLVNERVIAGHRGQAGDGAGARSPAGRVAAGRRGQAGGQGEGRGERDEGRALDQGASDLPGRE